VVPGSWAGWVPKWDLLGLLANCFVLHLDPVVHNLDRKHHHFSYGTCFPRNIGTVEVLDSHDQGTCADQWAALEPEVEDHKEVC
jgi:hypothetical protein